jgi:hypothetical protein
MQELIGVDIDLRRCHAWSSTRGRLCYKANLDELCYAIEPADDSGLNRSQTLLIECGSAHIYGLQKAALHNKLRWMIWNSYAVGWLRHFYQRIFGVELLCSPSSTWKHGLQEGPMMKILDITGDNHDIRQCRAMVAMYAKHPEDWVGIEQFMSTL